MSSVRGQRSGRTSTGCTRVEIATLDLPCSFVPILSEANLNNDVQDQRAVRFEANPG